MKSNILFPNGKYAFMDLIYVPCDYLLKTYKQFKNSKPDLFKWVKENMQTILVNGSNPFVEYVEEKVCNRFQYVSKKEAQDDIKRLCEKITHHHKPVRSYYCDNCNSWHITSQPIEQYKLYSK